MNYKNEADKTPQFLIDEYTVSGGAVVKNPPANAGNTGLILHLGRSHMLRTGWACEPQLLSLCSGAQDLSY